MKTLKIFLTLVLGFTFLSLINAQRHYDYRYDDHRMKRHHERQFVKNYGYDRMSTMDLRNMIERADRHGELNRREARRLYGELNDLVRLENKVYRNNRVTSSERRKLEREKDRLYNMIMAYTHNRNKW